MLASLRTLPLMIPTEGWPQDLPGGAQREAAEPVFQGPRPRLTYAKVCRSYGDRFWACATQAPHARYGPAG